LNFAKFDYLLVIINVWFHDFGKYSRL